ncbi:hypothetical protein H1R20_g14989, partial [Candolleomyces eurysporus]
MRYASFLLSFLVVGATTAFASPAAQVYQRATGFDLSDADLAIRNDGDVSVFYGRSPTFEEIRARDSAFAAATGTDLAVRDLLSEEEIEEIVLRHFDARDFDLEVVDLENRAWGAIARGVAKGVELIVKAIKGQIEHDKDRRGKYTSEFIGKSMNQFPQWNWVMCHTQHSYKFDGERGKDWFHRHEEFPVAFGKTVGFEIYWFKSGEFFRKGDGGYLNWSFGGNIIHRVNDGKDVKFGLRPGAAPIGKGGNDKKPAPNKPAPKKNNKPAPKRKGRK